MKMRRSSGSLFVKTFNFHPVLHLISKNMLRVTYTKRDALCNIHPNICLTIALLPKDGNLSQRENVMASQRKIKAEYLGVGEAEALTGVSRWTWRRMAYDGRVTSVKLGTRLLIPISEIERLVAENTRPGLRRGDLDDSQNHATAARSRERLGIGS
jgi:excisionase family DNA binding protein